jgi:hypothetical protein
MRLPFSDPRKSQEAKDFDRNVAALRQAHGDYEAYLRNLVRNLRNYIDAEDKLIRSEFDLKDISLQDWRALFPFPFSHLKGNLELMPSPEIFEDTLKHKWAFLPEASGMFLDLQERKDRLNKELDIFYSRCSENRNFYQVPKSERAEKFIALRDDAFSLIDQVSKLSKRLGKVVDTIEAVPNTSENYMLASVSANAIKEDFEVRRDRALTKHLYKFLIPLTSVLATGFGPGISYLVHGATFTPQEKYNALYTGWVTAIFTASAALMVGVSIKENVDMSPKTKRLLAAAFLGATAAGTAFGYAFSKKPAGANPAPTSVEAPALERP